MRRGWFPKKCSIHAAISHWPARWPQSLALIALFVIGAGAGSLIVLGHGIHRKPWVLLAEAVLLATGALASAFDLPAAAIAAIVLAMGLENAVFQIKGGAGLGLTYVTGALVKVGQLAAAALRGGARWAWAPNLLLRAALVAGCIRGALVCHRINPSAIWFAAGGAMGQSAIVAETVHR